MSIQAYGLGLSVWSPLHRGILGGIPAEEKAGPHNPRVSARQLDRLRWQLTEYEKLCAEVSQPPAQVALAWLLQRPGVTSTVVGPNTTEQLDGTVAALDLQPRRPGPHPARRDLPRLPHLT